MELQPQKIEIDAHDNSEVEVNYEAIREELCEQQRREMNKELPTAHLLKVDIEQIPDRDLAFWKAANQISQDVKRVYESPEMYSDREYWDMYDVIESMAREWDEKYDDLRKTNSAISRFYAYLANPFVLATGYSSILEKHKNAEARMRLISFKKAQLDPEADHHTAYLEQAEVSDLVESDLQVYRVLQSVEESEAKLAQADLLDRARAYAGDLDEAILDGLDENQKIQITDYVSLSLRLQRLWDSWQNVEKLDASRYDFYNYVGNRANVIFGNQELG